MWAYFNGSFIDKDAPVIHLEDRGLTFGDGIFEVIRTVGGEFFFFEEHLTRMIASAGFFGLPFHERAEDLHAAARELVRRNEVTDGELYLQLTRGVDPRRDHHYPARDSRPTFFMLAFQLRPIPADSWERGVRVITYPDLRGLLCEHKTVNRGKVVVTSVGGSSMRESVLASCTTAAVSSHSIGPSARRPAGASETWPTETR